jgi:hypothetical protein
VALFLLLGSKPSSGVSFYNGPVSYFLDDHSQAHNDRSLAVPIESEICKESESEEDGDDKISVSGHTISTSIIFDFYSGKLLFSQLILARESRASISLVILHHCWKSLTH